MPIGTRILCKLAIAGGMIAAAIASLPVRAQPASKPASRPALTESQKAANAQDPAIAAQKLNAKGEPDFTFMKDHEAFLKRAKEPIGVLFLGDSITEGWLKAPEIWKEHYGNLQPANFGIGGDRTQHVLWRIANGELDGISPKVVVLMIGTNNSGSANATDIARGVTAIVDAIKAKLPKTKILLLGIFPRNEHPKEAGRVKVQDTNAIIAKLDDGGKTVKYLEIWKQFLSDDGTLSKDIMPDSLHPNLAGYKIWADAMQPALDELLKE